MAKKRLLVAAIILLIFVVVLFYVINALSSKKTTAIPNETVATIGDVQIDREVWIKELEARYGKEVLQELVDEEVIHQAAKKYKVKITDEELDRELKITKMMYGTIDPMHTESEKQYKEQMKTSLLLEELLTKDVEISSKKMKKYFSDNETAYNIPTSYRISHIVVEKEKQAKQIIKELKGGSEFSVLAMEKSADAFTANKGGDLGYISKNTDQIHVKYLETVKGMNVGEWSEPFEIDEGWAIIYLVEVVKGEQFEYDDVKKQIRRQMALEQINVPVSGKIFWDELKVDWFYGN